jgi:hypothetical protein
MNTSEPTNWQTFKETLQKYPDLNLQFEYSGDQWVDASYHITEIKQAPIVSVDCGGVMNSWTEVILQLWEPSNGKAETAMQVHKALSIVSLVEKTLPLHPLAIVKIEFGNSQFDTRQMYPGEFRVEGENLVVNLSPDFTQCKAINRGGTCGTTESEEACCAPAVAKEKPKIKLLNLADSAQMCTPGSGCC